MYKCPSIAIPQETFLPPPLVAFHEMPPEDAAGSPSGQYLNIYTTYFWLSIILALDNTTFNTLFNTFNIVQLLQLFAPTFLECHTRRPLSWAFDSAEL